MYGRVQFKSGYFKFKEKSARNALIKVYLIKNELLTHKECGYEFYLDRAETTSKLLDRFTSFSNISSASYPELGVPKTGRLTFLRVL
jgi:hypothetical protein